MVGILIAGHASLAVDLLRTAESIIGRVEKCEAISVEMDDDRARILRRYSEAIARVGSKDGLLLLADIFGSSASNIACDSLGEYNVRIVTGVNLPMVLEMAAHRTGLTVDEMALLAERTGKKSIVRADLLTMKRKARSGP